MTDTSATETSRAVFYAWGEVGRPPLRPRNSTTVEVKTHVEISPPPAPCPALPDPLRHPVSRAGRQPGGRRCQSGGGGEVARGLAPPGARDGGAPQEPLSHDDARAVRGR